MLFLLDLLTASYAKRNLTFIELLLWQALNELKIKFQLENELHASKKALQAKKFVNRWPKKC